MLGQLTSPPEATHPTPSTPLIPQSIVGTNSPQLSTGVGELPFPPPINQFKGSQVQPVSLEEEIKQLEKKYADLVVSIRNAFKRRRVSYEKVQDCLLQLPVSLRQYAKLLQSDAARLCQASSINELFLILSPHWDFLNPSLLAHLAHSFGDEQAIRLVEEYLGELREFRKRTKVKNFIDKWTGTLLPATQEFIMELGDNWGEQSLEQLEEFRIEFSHKLCFEGYVMPLKGIKLSSVDAVFSLPESVYVDSFKLETLREFFQEHHILRILLNGVCILNVQLQQVYSCLLMCIASFLLCESGGCNNIV